MTENLCQEAPTCQEESGPGIPVEPACPCLFPDDLLSKNPNLEREPNLKRENGERADWWLVYTKSRQEKALAQQLLARSVPFYLPLIKRKSLSRGRTRIALVPLFAGYLFLYGTNAQRIVALETNRVSTTVQVGEADRLLADLTQIADLISKDAPLTPESRLVAGQRVRVKSGPFAGHEGVVFQRQGKTRFLVSVEYMQQGVSMVMDDYCLEPYESQNTVEVSKGTTSVNWALDRRARTTNRLTRQGRNQTGII